MPLLTNATFFGSVLLNDNYTSPPDDNYIAPS